MDLISRNQMINIELRYYIILVYLIDTLIIFFCKDMFNELIVSYNVVSVDDIVSVDNVVGVDNVVAVYSVFNSNLSKY